MKRYIRTKDNKLLDMNINIIINYYGFMNNILEESDNVIDLIEAGDLVEIDYGIETCIEKVCQPDRVKKCNVVAIYTKQGNDYILFARKIKEGWQVL